MTDSRAAADERSAIVRIIDRMLDNLANRSTPGFLLLEQLRREIGERGEKEKET